MSGLFGSYLQNERFNNGTVQQIIKTGFNGTLS